MKLFLYLFFAISLLSCSCTSKLLSVFRGDLKEIRFLGDYYPEDPDALKKLKERYIEKGHLEEGEIFEEEVSPRVLRNAGKERIEYPRLAYCYNKTENIKDPVFRNDLKVLVYDKSGSLVAEDYLRFSHRKMEFDGAAVIKIYIPYHEGGTFHIVRLEGGKKILVADYDIRDHNYIKERTTYQNTASFYLWGYSSETKCYYPPSVR